MNFNLASMITGSIDKSVNPCDNYYQYSCGNWIDKHSVKGQDALYDENHFDEIQVKIYDQLISIKINYRITPHQRCRRVRLVKEVNGRVIE